MDTVNRTIGLIAPTSPQVGGNQVTSQRWERIFRELGWNVFQATSWDGRECDVLVALHARKSHDSIVRFHRSYPERPLVVAGTGTDLYTDVEDSGEVREALGLSTRIVVLQPLALEELSPELRSRARVVYQSVPPPPERAAPATDSFQVCVLANLRPVKDPLLVARAVRRLPADSRVQVVHLGGAIDPALAQEAERETLENERYEWLRDRPREEALATLARSRLLVSPSRHEGGANVVSEALAMGVPILATRIPGALGLLGADYPGVFGVGDADALSELLYRAEKSASFYAELEAACRAVAALTDPALERESWTRLLGEVSVEADGVRAPGARE